MSEPTEFIVNFYAKKDYIVQEMSKGARTNPTFLPKRILSGKPGFHVLTWMKERNH